KLTKGQEMELAIMGRDGLARGVVPAHAPLDGDTIFAAATGLRALVEPPTGADRAWLRRLASHGSRHCSRRLRSDRTPGRRGSARLARFLWLAMRRSRRARSYRWGRRLGRTLGPGRDLFTRPRRPRP